MSTLQSEPFELPGEHSPSQSPPSQETDNFKDYLLRLPPKQPGGKSEHDAYTPSNYKVAPPDSVPRTQLRSPPSLPQDYSAASFAG